MLDSAIIPRVYARSVFTLIRYFMNSRYMTLCEQLGRQIDASRIITDPTLRFAYGTDASCYRLIPQVVVQAKSLDEVIYTLQCCREHRLPVTFRAAGTSLSGQAISDSILLMLTRDWQNHTIMDEGRRIRLQPGVIGANANQYLLPFQRKIGPDPASINTCKIGGIAANNASGMCCGTAQNSYQTVVGMTIVFADGAVLNTSDPESCLAFKQSHIELLTQLKTLSDECKANHEMSALISHKYRLKNTTGYALNSLVDFDDSIDILMHLMIGSEGTLGFIADITYETVVDHPHKASVLWLFNDIETTCLAVTALSETGVSAVELMDNRALLAVRNEAGMPECIRDMEALGYDQAAALLIEIREETAEKLTAQIQRLESLVMAFSPLNNVTFSLDPQECAQYWAIRKGVFPAVGAVRPVGTTAIIEDVSFPVADLAAAVRRLQQLFIEHDYPEAVIYGHALAGNLHFVFNQSFDSDAEISRYRDFMAAMAQLVVVEFKGALKAEHGTGRNMASFVELEWGSVAYAWMKRIKGLFDPDGLLNPGVILNDDPNGHLKHLKAMPKSDDIIDSCIECGFCEPVCPSRNLSLTPRQRNAVYREICRLKKTGEDPVRLSEFEKSYDYYGLKTCAATGLCADRCPVGINTGDLVRKLRQNHTSIEIKSAKWVADHFGTVTKLAKLGFQGVDLAHRALGDQAMKTVSSNFQRWTKGKLPLWQPEWPRGANWKIKPTIFAVNREKVVYFPSCSTRSMGTAKGAKDPRSLTDVTISLLEKAGYEVVLPDHLDDLCCGMPFTSKGFPEIATKKRDMLEENLWRISENGRFPILMDTSPCACLSKLYMRSALKIMEPFQFVSEFVLPRVNVTPQSAPIMLHITCTSRHKGLAPLMEYVAKQCAEHVIIPEDIYCCGFAGDKGFTTPELNASALAPLKVQVPSDCHEGYSNSITCEIGLSSHSGIEYRSILYLIDKVSQKLSPDS